MKSAAFRFVIVAAAMAASVGFGVPAAAQAPAAPASVAAAPAPAAPEDLASIKRQMADIQVLLTQELQQMFQNRPFTVLEAPKASFLPGFGLIVHTEVSLYHIVLMPMPIKLYAEQFKTEHAEKIVRVAALRKKLPEILVEEAGRLDERAENVAIIVHLFNPRPYPEVPDQILVQAPLETLRELRNRKASAAEIKQAITMREF